MSIAPGTTVTMEITAVPTREASRKTLMRLCRKDAGIARHHRTQTSKRPSQASWRRGGKMWQHQMRTRPVIRLAPGVKVTLRATVDVIRDLASVNRWVKVSGVK
jgi:hypothetical protein